jgi:hypothetical protein
MMKKKILIIMEKRIKIKIKTIRIKIIKIINNKMIMI